MKERLIDELLTIIQIFMVQVRIESGESFFPSRARINAEVAEEVGNVSSNSPIKSTFAPFIRLVSHSVLCRWQEWQEEEWRVLWREEGVEEIREMPEE